MSTALRTSKITMRRLPRLAGGLLCSAGIALMFSACSPELIKDPGADQASSQLAALQADPNLSSRAPLQMKDAQDAVTAAEVPQTDPVYSKHLAYIANDKVATAKAAAEKQYQQDQLKTLAEQREKIQVASRDAENDKLRQRVADLKASLNAKQTDRGIVFTLGDVLFETNKSDLKPGAQANLNRLVQFLQEYPDRSVIIEGYTDSTGSVEHNMVLSQARADSVRNYLAAPGIDARRLTSVGKGPGLPVADNNTAAGRQQNRRVEVIVSNPPPAPAAAAGN